MSAVSAERSRGMAAHIRVPGSKVSLRGAFRWKLCCAATALAASSVAIAAGAGGAELGEPRIAFSTNVAEGEDFDLWSMRDDGSDIRRLTTSDLAETGP